ncbi:hypothetical protein Tco_0369297 [Tanacetum coccineum]
MDLVDNYFIHCLALPFKVKGKAISITWSLDTLGEGKRLMMSIIYEICSWGSLFSLLKNMFSFNSLRAMETLISLWNCVFKTAGEVTTASTKLLLLEEVTTASGLTTAEGVNAASEEVSTSELVIIAYLKEFDLLKWDQQVVSELVALRNFAKRHGSRFCTHDGCIQSSQFSNRNGATLPKTQVLEGVTTVMPITYVKDKAQRRLEVKARSNLMMGIPIEHQLKFNSIKDAKLLLEAVKKRYGENAATKKTQRNLLKQQYENFTAPSSEMLDPTFDRLQKLVSQLKLLDKKLSQEDVNQKLLRSLSPEWNTHAVVWSNKAELEIMRIDDLYNNLKVYEPEVKGMSSSSSST